MRVLFMGTPDFSVGTLEKIIEYGHEVVGVVTQPDCDRGRGKGVSFSPVKEVAAKYGIPVFQPVRIRKEPEVEEQLRSLEPDVGVVIAFGQILPQSVLDIPEYGCLNVHASLLPAYRGAAPIQWSILDGCSETGVTIMQMDAGLDTGDILSRRVLPIEKDETGGSLHDKLAELGAQLLVDTLPQVEKGKLSPIKQGDTTTEYARMLTKEMGCIDWRKDAEFIDRQIRALNPWPSAFTSFKNKTFKIWKAEILTEEETCRLLQLEENRGKAAWNPEEGSVEAMGKAGEHRSRPAWNPGEIRIYDKKRFCVMTGKGILGLLEVQAEGKKRMAGADFLRGLNGSDDHLRFD